MPTPVLNRALAALNAGHIAEARALLTAPLKAQPRHADTLYIAGLVEQTAKQLDKAQTFYSRALTAQPEHAGAHYSVAMLMAGQGQHELAMPHHDAAVRLMPGNPWAWINRGNSLAALKHFEAALDAYERALSIQGDLPDAHTNKGNVLSALGLPDLAIQSHKNAISLNSNHAGAWLNLVASHLQAEAFEQALKAAETALTLFPKLAEAWRHKGVALMGLERPGDALLAFEQALELAPQQARLWTARGDALNDLGRFSEAMACHAKSLELQPDYALGWYRKATLLNDPDQHRDALSCYERAIALEPDNPEFHRSYALQLLSQGRLKEGWEHYEYRLNLRAKNNVGSYLQKPRWTGQPSDRTLLVWGEQGIGDQILFASALPELSVYPQAKTVVIDKRLVPLFRRSMPDLSFVGEGTETSMPDFAEQLPLGSLPRLFRPSLQHFPRKFTPYLQADSTRTASLRSKIQHPGRLVCGISWLSQRKHVGLNKSIQLEELLLALKALPLHFVNLQYGDTRAELDAMESQHGIRVQNVDEVDNYEDIDGLAALIQACDLVITVSNSTAHLAGALGKETALLLPLSRGRLWYWLEDNGRNPWYPTIKLLIQNQHGDWQDPVQRLHDYLQEKNEA